MPADGGMQSVRPPSAAGLTGIAEKLLSQCPVVVTGLLILARAIFESLGLLAPTVVEILAATHVSRSTAYETHEVLIELLPTLIRARGRPAKPPPAATDYIALKVSTTWSDAPPRRTGQPFAFSTASSIESALMTL